MRILLGLVAAGLLACSLAPANAQEWCGFLDHEHARVRCGFTSIKDCKQALHHKKNAICMPSPSFAKRAHVSARKS
jgi:hypothetical protein